MDGKLIAAAIPGFLLFILLEAWLLRRRPDPAYQLEDAVADLSLGIGQQAIQVFSRLFELAIYVLVWERLRLWDVPTGSAWAWVLVLLGVDLSYYAFHRASHRVRALWAIHAVHHQSEEYNLAVALRQAWLEPLAVLPFHLPLAILGVPPAMLLVTYTINTLYQFFVHTRGVGSLGPLEAVLNTPSHHRVHHAVNPEYIDRNYGGMLCVWDRVFGTFAREGREPAYGTVTPLRSLSPLWANAVGWVDLGRMFARAPRLADKLRVPFWPPEWRPAELGGPVVIPAVERATQTRFRVVASRGLRAYALLGLASAIAGVGILLAWPPAGWPRTIALALAVCWTVTSLTGLLERRPWARPVEAARLVAVVVAAGWMLTC